MQVVYWAHSYREQDASVNKHFGLLIERSERMMVNFDPPSKTVNAAKLMHNLRNCDGMIAVLNWRENGPSKYILYEIGLCLSARKPIIVFVDDRLPDEVLPPRVLQRRFSYQTYFRQFREHTASLRTLKSYLGEPPPTRYQPNTGRRMCGLIGLRGAGKSLRELVVNTVENRFYNIVDLDAVDFRNPLKFDAFEYLSNISIVILSVDAKNLACSYWRGAVNAAAIPVIALTAAKYEINAQFPSEFQPKTMLDPETSRLTLEGELDLFEQNFLSVDNADAIERYTKMQIQAGTLAGNYEYGTRRQFMEVIMGDQYNNTGQAANMGPSGHVHDVIFNQLWNKMDGKVDLQKLAEELATVRTVAEQRAVEPEQKLSVGAIAAAQESAKQQNGPKTMEYLRTAGRWALEIAQQIGVDVAKNAISGALGVG